MKKNLMFSVLIITTFLSCESEGQESEQLNIENQGNCAVATGEGLTMEFCLLDLDGTPRTTFQENQNYVFSLTLGNQSESTIKIGEDFIDPDFFKVINVAENKDLGVPYTGVWCEFSGKPREINIDSGESYTINCTWKIVEGDYPHYPLCKSESREYLPSGDYSTGIDDGFTIKKNGNAIQLKGNKNIQILFTIK